MTTLFIDTTNKTNLFAVLEDNKLQKIIINNNEDKNLSSKALVLIDKVLKESNINIKEIDNIIVVDGPGSFTGIRVGITISKTIAWALDKKINRINSLQLASDNKVESVVILEDRKDHIYLGYYLKKQPLISNQFTHKEKLLKILPNVAEIKQIKLSDFYNAENIKDIIKSIQIISKEIELLKSENPHDVNPVYIKYTQAELDLQQGGK